MSDEKNEEIPHDPLTIDQLLEATFGDDWREDIPPYDKKVKKPS